MALCRGTVARNRNSWGPVSMSSGFHRLEPDEEFAEEYTERMMSAQMRQLDPLKEDLAEWLNKNLGKWSFKSSFELCMPECKVQYFVRQINRLQHLMSLLQHGLGL